MIVRDLYTFDKLEVRQVGWTKFTTVSLLRIQDVRYKMGYMEILETVRDRMLVKWENSCVFICPIIFHVYLTLIIFCYRDTG